MGNIALIAVGVGIQLAIAYFFPTKIKGPRQENLKAQTSKYGDPIARVYGTAKVSAAVIWLKGNLVDEEKKTKTGKSLGPETTTFSYFATFAIAFASNGPADGIARVWADKKLVYDMGADGLQIAIDDTDKHHKGGVAKGSTWKVYLGSDTQIPDPDIEADIGVDLVPAWPGLVYMVIKHFPLEQFGIRVPNFEAEVIMHGTMSTVSLEPVIVDTSDHFDAQGDVVVSYDYSTGELTSSHLPDGAEQWTVIVPGSPNSFSQVFILNTGEVMVTDCVHDVINIFDGQTGALKNTILGATHSDPNEPFQHSSDINIDGTTYIFVAHWQRLSMFSNYVDPLDPTANPNGDYQWRWTSTMSEGQISVISAGPEFVYVIDGLSDHVYMASWTATTLGTFSEPYPALTEPHVIHYDQTSDSVIVADGVTDTIYIFDADMATLLRSTVSVIGIGVNSEGISSHRMMSDHGTFVIRTNDDFAEYELATLTLIREIDSVDTDWINKGTSAGNFAYVPNWDGIITAGSPITLWFFPRIARDLTPLAEVLEAECALVDLAVDVSEITKDIRGYAIRELTPPRGVIDDLIRLNFIDFSQQGGALKFVNRIATPANSISIDDMGSADADETDNPKLIEEEYPDFRELPARIAISYPAWDADYRIGTQTIQRPDGIDGTKATLSFSTPLVMTDDEAAQAADIMYNEMREATVQYKTKIPSIYLKLAAADVINLPLDDTRTVSAVITKIGGDTILEMEARLRTIDFTSDAVGTPTPTDDTDSILNAAELEFIAIDGHLMLPTSDEDAFYFGISRRATGVFTSGTIYRSTDIGASYNPWMAMTDETVRGYATMVLPDRPHPEAIDYASAFIVNMDTAYDAPASITEATMLASPTVNAFAVQRGTEWEYIRAASVIDNGNGTWTLSTLLRGRKGTEFAMTSHGQGDRVIYLDPLTMDRPPEGDKDLIRVYVPVATATEFSLSNAKWFTNTAKGLRPWSPVDIAGERDGSDNITVTATRRDRMGQEWPETGPEDPPMSEASESYKLFIYDTGALIRTITGSTLSFSYSAADQITDFGSPQSALDIGIVQVSATYGDGIEGQATI